MELSAASISAYQQQSLQSDVSVAVAAKAIKQIEAEGEMALQLLDSTVIDSTVSSPDPSSSLGHNIDVYA